MEHPKVWKFVVENAVVEVYVEPTNNKNMSIRARNGRVILQKPLWASNEVAHDFAQRSAAKFLPIAARQKQIVYFSYQEMYFLVFGEKRHVYKMPGAEKPLLKARGDHFYYMPVLDTEEELKNVVIEYATLSFKKFLLRRVSYFEKIMGLPTHQIAVSEKSSNWATNSLNLKKLIFSVNLFFYPEAIIDYVIVHELAHDFIPNHSTHFWQKVATFCPDYLALRKRLLDNPQMAEE